VGGIEQHRRVTQKTITRVSLSRRSLLAAAASAPFVSASARSTQASGAPARRLRRDRRPNIVFVITDDLRFDGLGCTGHPFAKTPNIDRIARKGASFTNFFTVVPLCSPSRASFLTGLYPHTHRIVNNDRQGLAETSQTLITFPRVLHEAGYESAFIGKWHMGFDDGRRPGFDHWVSFRGQGLYINPVVNMDDRREQLRGYMTDFLNERAARFIARPHQRPFVLFLAHKAVHYPYLPAKRHDSLYTGATYTPPPVAPDDLPGKSALSRRVPPVDVLRMEGATPEPQESRRGRPESADEVLRDQARCLASVDDGMGMILDALSRIGELDNTLVIFTSDNGYLMGEHGQFDAKRWAYEESLRIPLVARFPSLLKAGSRHDEMALNIDIAPTVLELAGVTAYAKMHGRSLVPVLRDSRTPWRDSFLAEHFVEKFVPNVPDWQCARTTGWKYIHFPGLENLDELYNLAADPKEIHNRINDPGAAEARERMKAELARLATETAAPPPDAKFG